LLGSHAMRTTTRASVFWVLPLMVGCGGEIADSDSDETDSQELAGTANVTNLSSRVYVGSGQSVAIAGFQLSGTKKVLIRGLGPSLVPYGISNAIANPFLELHNSAGAVIAQNDGWQSQASLIPASLQPGNPLEAALVVTLQAGTYTAILKNQTAAAGVGLVELYDLQPTLPAKLTNLSTRATVMGGDNILISGVTVSNSAATLVVRGIGPSLGAYGIQNPLPDPELKFFNGSGQDITNTIGLDCSANTLRSYALLPSDSREIGCLVRLVPGTYTIHLYPKTSGGVGLLELYDVSGCDSVAAGTCPNVSSLLDKVTGFAKVGLTTGGKDGNVCTVKNLYDSGANSLRDCASAQNRWIDFVPGLNGTINLASNIFLHSNTTIDGRGHNITITGCGMMMWSQSGTPYESRNHNVILENLSFTNNGGANCQLGGAMSVWNFPRVLLDHVDFDRTRDQANPPEQRLDKLLMIWQGSDYVTVSWSKFSNNFLGVEISANSGNHGGPRPGPEDVEQDRITFSHNWFSNNYYRNPENRYKHLDLKNNLIEGWTGSGVRCMGTNTWVLSRGNIFKNGGSAPIDYSAVTGLPGSPIANGVCNVRSTGDQGNNINHNAGVVFPGGTNVENGIPYLNTEPLEAANSTLESSIRGAAGSTQ